MNIPLTFLLIFSFAVSAPTALPAAQAGEKQWQRIDSEFVNLFFDGNITPELINRKIRIPNNIFRHMHRSPASNSPQDMLKAKLDTTFARVQEILNMYPRKIEVNVYIYSDVDELKAKYKSIYKIDFTNHRGEAEIISFYRYKGNSISIYVNNLAIPVLAHEIAHCVVSHYFIIQPPVNAQEILAMYVDQHFSDL